MTSPGITLTEQRLAGATASIDADIASDMWADIADAEDFQDALVDAVHTVASGRTTTELLDTLDDADIDVLHGSYATLIERTARGYRRALFDLLRTTRKLGVGRSSIDDIVAAARLFELAPDITPAIEIRIGKEFRDLRASVRRDACRVITALACGAEVHLVGERSDQRWLVETHRADLPVSREDITSPNLGPLDERVETARATLTDDGREVKVLRDLADASTETLAYSAIQAEHIVSESRVRQCLSQLEELGLIDTFDSGDTKHAELLTAGHKLLETLDQEIGRQRRLDECVSGTGNSSTQCRVSRAEHAGGGMGWLAKQPPRGRPPTERSISIVLLTKQRLQLLLTAVLHSLIILEYPRKM